MYFVFRQDIEKCDRLASFYGIKLDALMHYDEKVGNTKMAPPPEGKFLWGTVKLGNRGVRERCGLIYL